MDILVKIILGVICFTCVYMLRVKQRKIREIHTAAYDILKEEALCDRLQYHEENSEEDISYRLDRKLMLYIDGKHLKKKVKYVFNPEKSIYIGRNPKMSTICINKKDVSGQHCQIVKEEDGVWLRDLDSVNGTDVKRGVKTYHLKNRDAIMLKNKDEIIINDIILSVKFFYINRNYI